MKINLSGIAPSLLNADFSRLGEILKEMETLDCPFIHFDIMDGHFVPNLTFGAPIVQALRPYSKKVFDCHLMVNQPESFVDSFVKAGADAITFHWEATHHPHRLLQKIRGEGKSAGISLNPGTPVSVLEELLSDLDLILIMSVNPGFGGQSFIPGSLSKITKLSQIRKENNFDFKISVDGGVKIENIKALKNSGADLFVVGSALFSGGELSKNFHTLNEKIKGEIN